MNQKELISSALKSSMDYEEYKINTENEYNFMESSVSDEKNAAREINLARMRRIDAQFKPSIKTMEIIRGIDQDLLWIVISENWCGDSAQNLPIIAKISTLSDKINLRIILRDQNTGFMERYLTSGKRSILKLVIFNEDHNELATWGPRPESAQALMDKMIRELIEKSERLKRLHLWYAKNKGLDVENEISNTVKSISIIRNEYAVNQL